MSKNPLSLRGEPGVNYIRHLNAVMERFAEDDRLNPSHISLYLALFQLWNISHFPHTISVSREETMHLSKIGSRTTYLKCMNELTTFGYIQYQPSHNPFKGSKVMLFNFCRTAGAAAGDVVDQILSKKETSSDQVLSHSLSKKETSTEQALGPSINYSKHLKEETDKTAAPPSFEKILDFFKSQHVNDPELEARKFYNYYSALDWKVAGRHPVFDWHPLADNWALKTSQEFGKTQHQQNKDYNQPL